MLPTRHISSLGDALHDAFLAHRSRTALIEVDRRREVRRLTFDEVEAEARRVSALLAERGVGRGRRVAIVMSNQSRWLTTATAVFRIGAILVPVDYKLDAAGQAAIIAHSGAAVLVTEYPIWRTLADHLDEGTDVLVAHAPVDTVEDGQRLEAGPASAAPVRASVGRDDIACIVYSSGTGGTPKGCSLTHGNYLAQAESLGALFPMEPGERFFSILPTNHAIDFMTGFLMPFMFGATVVHQRSLRPEFLRFTLKRYAITHLAAVPRLLQAFEEAIREKLDALAPRRRAVADGLIRLNEVLTLARPNHALSSRLLRPLHEAFGGKLRFIFAGGAYVNPDLARFFYDLGIPIVIGYGLTEAGTVLTVNDLHPFRPDTVGRPVDGVEIDIRGAGDDGVGEVWARSETVMAGYLDEPELTAETIVDGWLRTGDLGWVDPAGHLHLVGRARNMIVTDGGKNVYPEDVEASVGGIDGVDEFCVVASDYVWPRGEVTGETLIAIVRPSDTGGDWLSALAARNRTLPDFKRLAGVVVWDSEFPRTASLKLKRGVLAEVLRGATDRSAIRLFDSEAA